MLSTPSVTNTQLNLNKIEQLGGNGKHDFQTAIVDNYNDSFQDIFAPVSSPFSIF